MTEKSNNLQVLIFQIGSHRACIDLNRIVQVYDSVNVESQDKHRHPLMLGRINVRGRQVPLFDIKPRWNLPTRRIELTDQLVVFRAENTTVSIIVDRVVGTRKIPRRKIVPLTEILPGDSPHQAVSEVDGIMLLLDTDMLFDLAGFDEDERR